MWERGKECSSVLDFFFFLLLTDALCENPSYILVQTWSWAKAHCHLHSKSQDPRNILSQSGFDSAIQDSRIGFLFCLVLKTGRRLQAGTIWEVRPRFHRESSRPPTCLLLPGRVSLCEEPTYMYNCDCDCGWVNLQTFSNVVSGLFLVTRHSSFHYSPRVHWAPTQYPGPLLGTEQFPTAFFLGRKLTRIISDERRAMKDLKTRYFKRLEGKSTSGRMVRACLSVTWRSVS